jgi:enoyl-CoA hydratase/3-hydroxyacyl-CoA dehydrogenase
MPIDEIRKVCFVGSGTMGCFNSLATAIYGYDCVLYDTSAQAVRVASQIQRTMGEMAVEASEELTLELIEEGLARISYTTELQDAVAEADLLSESVPERLDVKRAVHRELDRVCPAQTILTTNTSSLLVSEIEDVVKRGDKFAALHFHLGGALLDIVAGPRTAPETIDTLKRFARSIMQTPVVAKREKDGYLFNSMLIAMFKEAALLVVDGYADWQDVDRSYMAASGQGMGPFGGMDRVGLNVVLDILEEQGKRRPDEDLERVTALVRPFVERGELGWKTGKGFYSYPEPDYEKPEFLLGED